MKPTVRGTRPALESGSGATAESLVWNLSLHLSEIPVKAATASGKEREVVCP